MSDNLFKISAQGIHLLFPSPSSLDPLLPHLLLSLSPSFLPFYHPFFLPCAIPLLKIKIKFVIIFSQECHWTVIQLRVGSNSISTSSPPPLPPFLSLANSQVCRLSKRHKPHLSSYVLFLRVLIFLNFKIILQKNCLFISILSFLKSFCKIIQQKNYKSLKKII